MRKLSLKKILGISYFLLTIALAAAVAFPVYSKVSKSIKGLSEEIFNTIREKTGLVVTYKSLSPSIFSGLNLSQISVVTEDDNMKLCHIKKVHVRYNLFSFAGGQGLKAIKNVTLNGFVLDMDDSNYQELMERLGIVTEKESSAEDSKLKKKKEFSLGKITTEIPFNVFFKNVQINFETSDFRVAGMLKKMTFAFLKQNKTLIVDTSGNIRYYCGENKKDVYSAAFSAQGNLPQKLNGSSLILRTSDISNGTYSIGKLNLLFGYNNDVFDIRTIQNGFPLFVHGSYDINSEEGSFEVNAARLKPGAIISSRRGDKTLKKIKKLSVSLKANAFYSRKTRKLNYSSDGKIYVPDTIFHGGFDAEYSLKGDENRLNLSKFGLQGQNIDVAVDLSYKYQGMGLDGTASINRVVLPNGGVVSTEIFFDPQKSGFMAFAPQLMLDEKALTGLQLSVVPVKDSIDFGFELSDYCHSDSGFIGKLKLDGSYIGGTNYVQLNLETNGMYLDSLAQTGMFFVKKPEDKADSFSYLSSFMLNGQMFFSTDMKAVSFNVPYLIAANVKNDGQLLYLSLDGNDNSISVTRFDYVSDGKMTHAEAQYEKSPDSKDAFFVVDINADAIPYHFTGNIMPESVNVSGDYGFTLDVFKTGLDRYDGSLTAEAFPVPVNGFVAVIGADAGFSYNSDEGIRVQLVKLEAEEASGKFAFNPKFFMAGEVNKYGAFLSNITYSDIYSTLQGSGEGSWVTGSRGFESATAGLSVLNPASKEEISLDADISSSEEGEMFINAKLLFNVFGLNRFTAEVSDNNTLTASVIATGPLDNPFVGVNIDNFSLMTAGNTISASGSMYLEDKIISVEKIKAKYNTMVIDNLGARFQLSDFTGKLTADFSTDVMGKTLKTPLVFTVSDTFREEGESIPSEFVANLECTEIGGSFVTKKFPLSLSIVHSKNSTMVYTSEAQGISGTISNDGNINFSISKGKPLSFNLSGNVAGNGLNLALSGVNADLGSLLSYIQIPMLNVYEGILKGSMKITGLKNDPEFMGAFSLNDADFSLPGLVPSHITVPKTIITMNHNRIQIPETRGLVKKQTPVYADLDVLMDRWGMDYLKSHVYFPKNAYAPGDVDARIARFTGEANIDLMIAVEDGVLGVTGDVKVRNLVAQIVTKELARNVVSDDMPMRYAIKIGFGTHVSFRFDPLIRAVFVPDSEFTYYFDSTDGSFKLDGELALRSGDISYLNRNFYLKKGTMKFNANDPTFNPLISVSAETRERDDDGNDIRIMLTAMNQYLLNFNPHFSSIPARSETEIRTMLGQIALGDSDSLSGLLLSAGDYAVQSLIGRNIENKLREFLNFDILSIRTNVLQNALKQSLTNGLSLSSVNSIGIGNFLDNSTVYIGKYFGSDLYLDALMHWTYDDTRVDDTLTIGGLVFKPELGFEMSSPFVNIRWSMAPDIDAMMNNRVVSSTSVTLSWNFSF